MVQKISDSKASVLIFSLWVLMMLTVFVSAIGLKVRQRIMLASTLEERSRFHHTAEAAVKLAIAFLRQEMVSDPLGATATAKAARYNNPEIFKELKIEDGTASVGHEIGFANGQPVNVYGLVDEERKVNINTADRNVLSKLIGLVSHLSEAEIYLVVESIIDWREIGHSQLLGSSSDAYYEGLPQPYAKKNAPFELVQELMLVQGMDEELYKALEPYITIYGDGLVNVNTAPLTVLMALGLEEPLAQKLIAARAGQDEVEASADDHVFINPYDVTRDLQNLIKLEKEEVVQVDFLNASALIGTSSYYYRINAIGRLGDQRQPLRIDCVYNSRNNIIEYWRENN
jgi:general secretion pathway protein K